MAVYFLFFVFAPPYTTQKLKSSLFHSPIFLYDVINSHFEHNGKKERVNSAQAAASVLWWATGFSLSGPAVAAWKDLLSRNNEKKKG